MAMEKEKWLDISVETERTYHYLPENPGDPERTFTIKNPVQLNVSESSLGGHAHRVTTKDNQGIYVAPGWVAISWKVPEGAPIFKF